MKRKKAPAKDAEDRSSRLSPEEKRSRVFQRATKLLAARPRSVEELRERLSESRFATKSNVDEVIDRLREYGYLDDERFAFSFASSRVQQRPVGRRKLERDLSQRKVSRTVASEALDLVFGETSEADLIDRAIEKRTRLRGRPKTREEAKKLFDHLLRQGFPFDLVSDKVRALAHIDSDD